MSLSKPVPGSCIEFDITLWDSYALEEDPTLTAYAFSHSHMGQCYKDSVSQLVLDQGVEI